MKKTVLILLSALFIFSTSARSQTDYQLTNEQKARLLKANRHEKNGWIYLHIEGRMDGLLKDLPTQPWTMFEAGESE